MCAGHHELPPACAGLQSDGYSVEEAHFRGRFLKGVLKFQPAATCQYRRGKDSESTTYGPGNLQL